MYIQLRVILVRSIHMHTNIILFQEQYLSSWIYSENKLILSHFNCSHGNNLVGLSKKSRCGVSGLCLVSVLLLVGLKTGFLCLWRHYLIINISRSRQELKYHSKSSSSIILPSNVTSARYTSISQLTSKTWDRDKYRKNKNNYNFYKIEVIF